MIAASLEMLADDGFKAGVILADPPWTFETYSDKGKDRSAENHYPTMTIDDIKALGPVIRATALDNCLLALWAVMPRLPDALEVMAAWGFVYKTCGFVWAKTSKNGRWATGLGYWTRANAELCLIGTRGRPKRLAMDVHSLVVAERQAHSVKPAIVHHRLERLVAGPYLELFGRQDRLNWMVWGNAVTPLPDEVA